jgi:uncharacterized membrane protein
MHIVYMQKIMSAVCEKISLFFSELQMRLYATCNCTVHMYATYIINVTNSLNPYIIIILRYFSIHTVNKYIKTALGMHTLSMYNMHNKQSTTQGKKEKNYIHTAYNT